jgi:hypothetical protein
LVGVPLTPEQFHLDDLGLDEIVDHYDGIGRALHAPPTVPAWVDRAQAEHYASAALTEYNEFRRRLHFILGQPGWEEVADYALDWAVRHTVAPAGAR